LGAGGGTHSFQIDARTSHEQTAEMAGVFVSQSGAVGAVRKPRARNAARAWTMGPCLSTLPRDGRQLLAAAKGKNTRNIFVTGE